MFITKWGKLLSSHIYCEHTQYTQFHKRWNSYIQAQWQRQDFILSSQTGAQSSLSPGSLARLTPSFLSSSTRIFSNPEMHAHVFLLFPALFCIASILPKKTSQGLGPLIYLQHLTQHLRSTVEGVWGFFRNEVSQAKILIQLRNLLSVGGGQKPFLSGSRSSYFWKAEK